MEYSALPLLSPTQLVVSVIFEGSSMFGSRCAQHPHGTRKASEFQSAEARERRGVGCKWSSAEGCQIRMKRDLIIYSYNYILKASNG